MANKINIIVDAKDNASKKLKKIGGNAKALGKAAVLGGAVAGVAIAGVAVASINAAREQIKVEKQLDAVLKSTGGAAGLTAKEIKKMASELQKSTNFGDEATIAGQNMLLTFTKIGKDTFPRATKVMLDMSAAMGQDLKQSAVLVGKALNDPIAGVSALSRVGVQFTQGQKDMIEAIINGGKALDGLKTAATVARGTLPLLQEDLAFAKEELDRMTASGKFSEEQLDAQRRTIGDLDIQVNSATDAITSFEEAQKIASSAMTKTEKIAAAQGIILKELETQFKGSAKAQADPMIQLKNAVGDVAEEIGKGLLPVITPLVKTLVDKMPGAIDKVKKLFGKFTETVDENAGAIDDLKVLANLAFEAIQFSIETLAPIFKFQMGIMKGALGLFLDGISLLRDGAEWLDNNFTRIINGIADSLTSIPGVAGFLTGGISSLFGGGGSSETPDEMARRQGILPGDPRRARYGLFDDFIMRPGQAPIAINPNDTIVGFKGNAPNLGGGMNITIQNTFMGSADPVLVERATRNGIISAVNQLKGNSRTALGAGL